MVGTLSDNLESYATLFPMLPRESVRKLFEYQPQLLFLKFDTNVRNKVGVIEDAVPGLLEAYAHSPAQLGRLLAASMDVIYRLKFVQEQYNVKVLRPFEAKRGGGPKKSGTTPANQMPAMAVVRMPMGGFNERFPGFELWKAGKASPKVPKEGKGGKNKATLEEETEKDAAA